MSGRAILGLTALVLGLLAVAGCDSSKDGDPPLREEPFEVRPFAVPGPAVCYGPHRDGQRPDEADPSATELREDLALMAPHWKTMRIYGSRGFAGMLLEIIRIHGFDMKVVLGMWIAPEADEANLAEVARGIELANEYEDIVVAVSVGNETQVHWSAHRSSEQKLVEYIRRVRSQVKVPVTTADDFNFWNKPESRLVAGEVDFILMHAHPLWNGQQLEDALPWLDQQVTEIRNLHPNRLVVLGETGWATSVHDEGEQARLIEGAVGEEEQKRFFENLQAWIHESGLTVFHFEAFDEKWKGGDHPAEVEKHWGLFRSDRTPKAALETIVSR